MVYEALNQDGPTFVYRGEAAAVNRALDDAGFRGAAVPAGGQVPHGARWADQFSALLADLGWRGPPWPAGPTPG